MSALDSYSRELFKKITVVEKDFSTFYLQSSVRGMRIGLSLAIVLFLAFGIMLDTLVIQWAIRLGVVIPVLSITLFLSFRKVFRKYSQWILSMAYLLTSVALVVIIYYTPKEANRDVYCTGLSLCIFGASAIRLQTRAMLIVTPVILSFYVVLLHFQLKDLIIHLPLLFSASVLSLLATSSSIKVMKANFKMLTALSVERRILYETKERLEESDLLKSKLLSILSHDLRGPVNGMLSLLGLRHSGTLTGRELDNILYSIEKRVTGTKELLEDLLAWSLYKIEGRQDLAKINLADVVDECFGQLAEASKRKNNRLVNQTPEMIVISDLKLLRLILRNMVSNSIKFTEAGEIVCSAEQRSENSIAITVSDTGTGISETSIERLFNWNTRFSMPGTRNEVGSGLGLLICQDFLESVGGSIWVESELGRGTTFHILLKTKLCNLTRAA